MKRLLTAAAIALMTATAAHAAQATKAIPLLKSGYWETFAMAKNDAGIPMCGMRTEGNSSAFFVKWTPEAGMVVQAAKYSWRLPKDAKVHWQLEFIDNAQPDDNATITAQAGWVSSTGSSVYMGIDDGDTDKFLQAFGDADKLKLNFPDGDEPSWGMKMDGSRKAAAEFAKCIAYLKGTSPVAKAKPTSPISPSVKQTSPMPPVQPTDDRKRVTKDDGSV